MGIVREVSQEIAINIFYRFLTELLLLESDLVGCFLYPGHLLDLFAFCIILLRLWEGGRRYGGTVDVGVQVVNGLLEHFEVRLE